MFCFRLLLSLSHVWLFVTLWTAARQVFLSFTISWSWLKLMSIESMMSSNHLILCCPLLLLPSTFSSIRSFLISPFFASGGPSIRASESLLPMNIQGWFPLGLTGLISLRVQGTLKSLLQHHNLKASVLQCSTCFIIQLSHLYMTTGKIIALTIWIFVGNVISLLFNMLSKFVIIFLPMSKWFLISWLQSPPTVILEPKKIISVTPSTISPFAIKWWDQIPWS